MVKDSLWLLVKRRPQWAQVQKQQDQLEAAAVVQTSTSSQDFLPWWKRSTSTSCNHPQSHVAPAHLKCVLCN